jgi:hypothetical protein
MQLQGCDVHARTCNPESRSHFTKHVPECYKLMINTITPADRQHANDCRSRYTRKNTYSFFKLQSSSIWKYFPYSTLPDLHKSIAFWKVPRLLPFVLLITVTWIWGWSIGGNIQTGENRGTRGKTFSQCQFVYHKSHTAWTGNELGASWWQAGEYPSDSAAHSTH